jgi:hypothetical protein
MEASLSPGGHFNMKERELFKGKFIVSIVSKRGIE